MLCDNRNGDWDEEINAWILLHGGGAAPRGNHSFLGWAIEGELVGGIVFYANNGRNCWANIALAGGWNPAGLILAGLKYSFDSDQLALHRLTFLVSAANIASINFVTGLGADHEATLQIGRASCRERV